MKLFHEVVVKMQSLHGYRRIAHVAVRSVKIERHEAIEEWHMLSLGP